MLLKRILRKNIIKFNKSFFSYTEIE